MLRNGRHTNDPRFVPVTLRALGGIDMLASVAVVMPRAWMDFASRWAGLGELPDVPIVGYLARSASALYALHGLLVVYMSLDVRRYWKLIRFFAVIAVFHGLLMLAVDVLEQMPLWWTLVEGPTFSATGAFVLLAQARADAAGHLSPGDD